MNENRTFGLEVEFISSEFDKRTIARHITVATGIVVESQSYNHRVTQGLWKLVTDGSLSSGGLELVSPPLKGEDGMRQVEEIMNTLANIKGVKVNRSCGVHVHHNINDINLDGVKRIVGRYVKAEKAIDSLMPESRRSTNNRYCKTMIQARNEEFTLRSLKRATSIEGIVNMFGGRYVKLNLQSYVKYGTIEFRQHAGTTEFEKIKNWILLTQKMVDTGSSKKLAFTPAGYDKVKNLVAMFNLNEDEESKSIKKYYTARAKALAV